MKKSITIELITFENKKMPSIMESIISEENNRVERINAITANNQTIMDTVLTEAVVNLSEHLNNAFEPLQMKAYIDKPSYGKSVVTLCSEGQFHSNRLQFIAKVGQKRNEELGLWEMDTNVEIECCTRFEYNNEHGFGMIPFVDADTLMEKYPDAFREFYKLVAKKLIVA